MLNASLPSAAPSDWRRTSTKGVGRRGIGDGRVVDVYSDGESLQDVLELLLDERIILTRQRARHRSGSPGRDAVDLTPASSIVGVIVSREAAEERPERNLAFTLNAIGDAVMLRPSAPV
jgi:hypothetical protein